MKPITKKILEYGLVPKHTILLMQRWGYLDPETSSSDEPVKNDIKESFFKFVEELEELLEEEDDIKETTFSTTLKDPIVIQWEDHQWDDGCVDVVVFKDDLDRLIFPASSQRKMSKHRRFRIKTRARIEDALSSWFEITNFIPLWSDDTIVAYQVEVSLINAALPKLL